MKQRNYGVRTCVWCGKEFIAKSSRSTSCGDIHYRPCIDCGKLIEVKETYRNYMAAGGRRCMDCRKLAISKSHLEIPEDVQQEIKAKRAATNIAKFGTEHAMQSEEVKQRGIATLQDRYGVVNAGQIPEVREKVTQTVQERYGGYTLQSPKLRAKVASTMKSRYGTVTPLKAAPCIAKQKATNLSRYGVEQVFQSDKIKDKVKKTCLEKFGVPYAAQAPEVIERRTKTNMKLYGASAYIFSDNYLKTIMSNPDKFEQYLVFKSNPKQFIFDTFGDVKPTMLQIAEAVGLCSTQISVYVIDNKLHDYIAYNKSTMEVEVKEFLNSIIPDIEIIPNYRKIISPKEVDLYLPQYNFGIECNPAVSHNSSLPFISADVMPPSYHANKSKGCTDAGVFLFHLFGYEWTHKRSIIESMIRNILNVTPYKYYGRNTQVVELDNSQCVKFLQENHRQGATTSSVRLGLKDKQSGNILSVMTFGKLRPSMGKTNSTSSEGVWELSRFCNLLNTTVVGGASKLLKYFLNNYQPTKIVSFSDIAHTRGALYQQLGFTQVSISAPSYVWVNPNTEDFYTRYQCQKQNLRKLFNDDTIDIDNLTEAEIMISHGYVQVFDSGVIRWEYSL